MVCSLVIHQTTSPSRSTCRPECKQAVDGYHSAVFKKFTCFSMAMAWLILRGEDVLNISANINEDPANNGNGDDSNDTDTSFTVVKGKYGYLVYELMCAKYHLISPVQHGLSSLTLTDHS